MIIGLHPLNRCRASGTGTASFHSPRRGLYLATTTQIYPEDRGTNYSARLGREVAERIAADG